MRNPWPKRRCTVALLALLVLPPGGASAQTLRIEAVQKAHFRDWSSLFRSDAVLSSHLKTVFSKVALPRPVSVTFADTGKVNAWYSPSQHSVTVDYAMADFVMAAFQKDSRFREKAEQLTQRTLRFFLLHELGHAIIAELNVPYAGKNEDCADELAVIMASQFLGEQGLLDAQAAAQWFVLVGWSKQADVTKVAFWDEHSFDLQRYYNILIDLEASHPGLLPDLSKKVAAERLNRARLRWPGKIQAWGFHLRKACPNLSQSSPLPGPQPGTGTIALRFEETSELDLAMIRQEAQKWPIQRHLQSFEKLFILPRNLEVVFVNARTPLFRYQHDLHRLAISYGWILETGKFLGGHVRDGSLLMSTLGSVLTLELSVRLQQMLIEELHIPVTGEPEDASVELLTLAFVDNPGLHKLLLEAATFYRWRAQDNPFMLTYDFSSEDDLHHQRFLDLYMSLYCRNPREYAAVENWVPADRLRRAQQELPVKLKNWERLILPYVRH